MCEEHKISMVFSNRYPCYKILPNELFTKKQKTEASYRSLQNNKGILKLKSNIER